MYQNISKILLVGILVVGIGFATNAKVASAAMVTDQVIDKQEQTVKTDARETVESYLRLILYVIIQRLEAQGATA